MNTDTDEVKDETTLQNEIQGEASETIANTEVNPELADLLPSTKVEDILPAVESDVVEKTLEDFVA